MERLLSPGPVGAGYGLGEEGGRRPVSAGVDWGEGWVAVGGGSPPWQGGMGAQGNLCGGFTSRVSLGDGMSLWAGSLGGFPPLKCCRRVGSCTPKAPTAPPGL